MNTPLGRMIGNRLEIIESIEILKGQGPKDTTDLTEELGAKMLVLAGIYKDMGTAKKKIQKRYETGLYLDRFRKIIELQGGNPKVIDDYNIMKPSEYRYEFKSDKDGIIIKEDAYLFGMAALVTGAGRERKEDEIDHSCGIELLKKEGENVSRNETILIIHYNNEAKLRNSLKYIKKGISIE